ncbi:MAG: alkaline phosphatase family protein [Planctomycetes bacterium]|nr:alkaline phosphatase family protein [Planctomycetota bacterium]
MPSTATTEHASGCTRTVVINVVGLSARHIGAHTPRLKELARSLGGTRPLRPDFPAVTCVSQASMLTGLSPRDHGVVANGWYDREQGEARLWRQSNALMHGEKVWEAAKARNAKCTTANLFWWFNMNSTCDWSVTPRPIYTHDGRKIPDVSTEPPQLRESLQQAFGRFPLFDFWGPRAGIRSSDWIAQAALRVMRDHDPALTLIYLPHLDYVLQREGPQAPSLNKELREVDRIVGALLDACAERKARPIVLSEYGIEAATQQVHPNRALRQAGLVEVRDELGRDMLEPMSSPAFALCDHQVAHVYVRNAKYIPEAAKVLASLEGVERVLDRKAQAELSLDHSRGGDLVLVAKPGAWFAYPWWLDDARAPDFARCVDIHKKPGFDPCELLVDPEISLPALRVAKFKLARALGFRSSLRLTPLDASLVKGTHGRAQVAQGLEPVVLAENALMPESDFISCRDISGLILRHLFETRA